MTEQPTGKVDYLRSSDEFFSQPFFQRFIEVSKQIESNPHKVHGFTSLLFYHIVMQQLVDTGKYSFFNQTNLNKLLSEVQDETVRLSRDKEKYITTMQETLVRLWQGGSSFDLGLGNLGGRRLVKNRDSKLIRNLFEVSQTDPLAPFYIWEYGRNFYKSNGALESNYGKIRIPTYKSWLQQTKYEGLK